MSEGASAHHDQHHHHAHYTIIILTTVTMTIMTTLATCTPSALEAMAYPPTHEVCLTSLSVCSHPLQTGRTPLHRAAQEDASATAEVLIKSEANLEAKDKVGGMVLKELALWHICCLWSALSPTTKFTTTATTITTPRPSTCVLITYIVSA